MQRGHLEQKGAGAFCKENMNQGLDGMERSRFRTEIRSV